MDKSELLVFRLRFCVAAIVIVVVPTSAACMAVIVLLVVVCLCVNACRKKRPCLSVLGSAARSWLAWNEHIELYVRTCGGVAVVFVVAVVVVMVVMVVMVVVVVVMVVVVLVARAPARASGAARKLHHPVQSFSHHQSMSAVCLCPGGGAGCVQVR